MAVLYRRILVAIENSDADQAILTHIAHLAGLTGASLVLVHVADGWAARHFDELKLKESEEMKADRAYLEKLKQQLSGKGFAVETRLATGDPATELVRAAETESADLVAMATHGHRFIADVIHGATADKVRHLVKVPVLLLRA
jgi:nucleotide-binding universal stress UspA family protein